MAGQGLLYTYLALQGASLYEARKARKIAEQKAALGQAFQERVASRTQLETIRQKQIEQARARARAARSGATMSSAALGEEFESSARAAGAVGFVEQQKDLMGIFAEQNKKIARRQEQGQLFSAVAGAAGNIFGPEIREGAKSVFKGNFWND